MIIVVPYHEHFEGLVSMGPVISCDTHLGGDVSDTIVICGFSKRPDFIIHDPDSEAYMDFPSLNVSEILPWYEHQIKANKERIKSLSALIELLKTGSWPEKEENIDDEIPLHDENEPKDSEPEDSDASKGFVLEEDLDDEK